jgi:hypothetical protein
MLRVSLLTLVLAANQVWPESDERSMKKPSAPPSLCHSIRAPPLVM